MDAIFNAKKLKPMKIHKTHRFLHHIFFHLLVAFTCCLLCSYPYWFPSLCSSIKQFLFLSLTSTTYSSFLGPKFLFLVFNVILICLVGESVLLGSHSSPAAEIYDEYVERNRSLGGVPSSSTLQEKEVEFDEKRVSVVQDEQMKEEIKRVIEETEEEEEEIHDVHGEAQEREVPHEVEANKAEMEEDEEEKERDGEEETGLATEELNRKVEDFIARVNKQRWLEEASLLVSCSA